MTRAGLRTTLGTRALEHPASLLLRSVFSEVDLQPHEVPAWWLTGDELPRHLLGTGREE